MSRTHGPLCSSQFCSQLFAELGKRNDVRLVLVLTVTYFDFCYKDKRSVCSINTNMAVFTE